MKTYSKVQYVAWASKKNYRLQYIQQGWNWEGQMCNCISWLEDSHTDLAHPGFKFYENCPTCAGRGIAPIPWQEL